MRISMITTIAISALGLAACDYPENDTVSDTAAPEELALFGDGYPEAGDPCRRAGESTFTNQFLDDAADLVACPPGTDASAFAPAAGASEVAQVDGWIVFSVPRH